MDPWASKNGVTWKVSDEFWFGTWSVFLSYLCTRWHWLKKSKVFQHLWKYIFRNYDSVAERIKVTCCNRVIQWGVCFQLQNPVITGNSPLLLGLRKIVSALGLSFDIIEQGISALGSEFRTFSPGLSCLGLNSSSLSILDDLLFVY